MRSHYRGWHSTKLHLALITMGLLTFAFAMTGFSAVAFGEYCMALIGAAGVYSSTAAVEKFVKPQSQKVDSPD